MPIKLSSTPLKKENGIISGRMFHCQSVSEQKGFSYGRAIVCYYLGNKLSLLLNFYVRFVVFSHRLHLGGVAIERRLGTLSRQISCCFEDTKMALECFLLFILLLLLSSNQISLETKVQGKRPHVLFRTITRVILHYRILQMNQITTT